jgi:hypothetical protein
VEDEMSEKTKLDTKEEKSPRFMEDNQCVLWYKGRICMPKIKELKDKILREAHESAYSIHPGGNKMYRDLNSTYWWYGMKRDVIKNVALLRRLSESQDSASMAYWDVVILATTRAEVGRDCYGFIVGSLGPNRDMIPFG